MTNEQFDQAAERLQLPFALNDLDWVPNFTYPKPDQKTYDNTFIGVAPYVRREAIISRLNVLVGPGSWETIMEPLSNFGLYQGLAINNGGEWVRKFDGSRLTNNDNDSIDSIKSVVSKSLRRVAELWGIGTYLHFVPQLFAVKRPSDDYDAAETWSGKGSGGNYIKIRWDYPDLPKEFLPDFMTPEQLVRMKRIRRYMGEDKRSKADEMISSWMENHESIEYSTAEEIIHIVESNVKQRLSAINPKAIVARTPRQAAPPAQKTTPAPATPTEPATAPAKQEPTIAPNDGNTINEQQYEQLVSKVKQIMEIDPNGENHKPEILERVKAVLNSHKKGSKLLGVDDYTKILETLNTWITACDDGLPF